MPLDGWLENTFFLAQFDENYSHTVSRTSTTPCSGLVELRHFYVVLFLSFSPFLSRVFTIADESIGTPVMEQLLRMQGEAFETGHQNISIVVADRKKMRQIELAWYLGAPISG